MSATHARGGLRASVILVPGRDGESLARALRAVTANRGVDFDVWVVNTADEEPGVVLDPAADTDDEAPGSRAAFADPRIRRLRTAAPSSAAAHNDAIANASGEILAITDVDCEVDPSWVAEMLRAFECDPRIAVVFGRVEPADPEDRSTPAYLVEEEFLARGVGDARRVGGIWACMGVRRTAWESLGGFDERFGRGARFPGSADVDLALRALAAGHFVLETPRPRVRSHRALTPAEHRRAVGGYTYAAGALIGKHLRRRTPGTLGRAASSVRRGAAGRSHAGLGRAAPHPVRRLASFVAGVGAGFLSVGEKGPE